MARNVRHGKHRECGATITAIRVKVFEEWRWTFYHTGMLVVKCPSCGLRLYAGDVIEEEQNNDTAVV